MTNEGSICPASILANSGARVAVDVCLVRLKRQTLVHRRAERDVVQEADINSRNGERAAFAAAIDGLAERVSPIGTRDRISPGRRGMKVADRRSNACRVKDAPTAAPAPARTALTIGRIT